MSERVPIDKYSKTEYEQGLARVAKAEKQVSEHPLQEELSVHAALRQGSEGPYAFSAEEEAAKARLAEETAGLEREIAHIKQDLWRQLSNAHTEALAMDAERESREVAEVVLPHMIEIESETRGRMESADLPGKARAYGRAIIEIVEKARVIFKEHKKIPSAKVIKSIANAVAEMYTEFRRFAGNVLAQDRYGDPTGSAA